jgi:hypothetical protein
MISMTSMNSVYAAEWYVKAAAKGGGKGTKAKPFNTLADAQAASKAGDTIYIRQSPTKKYSMDKSCLSRTKNLSA